MTLLWALQDDDYWRKGDNIGLAVEDVLDERYRTRMGAWLGEFDASDTMWKDEEHLLLGGGCDDRDGWSLRALRLIRPLQ